MSSFFTAPASQRKRKRQDASSTSASKKRSTALNAGPANQAKAKSRKERDDSISGSESEDDASHRAASDDESEQGSDTSVGETAAERRLKLAERYLEDIRAEVAEGQEIGFDAEEIDRELIAARLKEDVAEGKGRIYRHIAGQLDYENAQHTYFRADSLAATGVAVCAPYIYTVHKDMTLIKWELADPENRRKKPKQLAYTRGNKNFADDSQFKHHTAPILCVAASADGKFVVTGGADRRLIVWDPSTLKPLKVFMQHRDAVTAVVFRGKTNQLFTASKDRTIKIWSLNELAYIETLFGHQDEVVDVAAVGGDQERCVSVGARDRTARLWKVVEESQLVFRGGGLSKARTRDTADGPERHRSEEGAEETLVRHAEGSLDRVIQLDTQLFVTGSDSGALSLYALYKKKPLHTISLAHGTDPPLPLNEASAELSPKPSAKGQPRPRWITALACVPFSDLFLSGSWDGCIRAWRTSEDMKRIEAVGVVGDFGITNEQAAQTATSKLVRGVVNDLAVFEKGDRGKQGVCVVAAVGTECRLGRWMEMKGRNGAMVFDVPRLLDGRNNGILHSAAPDPMS